MSLLDNLPHQCRVQSKTKTKGTLGSSKNTPTTVNSGVACWEQQASASEITEYEKQGMSVNRKVYFATNPSVTERHEIVITSRDAGSTTIATADEVVLEVRSDSRPDASAGLGVLYKVMAEERTGRDQ